MASTGLGIEVGGEAPYSPALRDPKECPEVEVQGSPPAPQPLYSPTGEGCSMSLGAGDVAPGTFVQNVGFVDEGTQPFVVVKQQIGANTLVGCLPVKFAKCLSEADSGGKGASSSPAASAQTGKNGSDPSRSPQPQSPSSTGSGLSASTPPAKTEVCVVKPTAFYSSEKCFQDLTSPHSIRENKKEKIKFIARGTKVCADPSIRKQDSYIPLWQFQAKYLIDHQCILETKSLDCKPGSCSSIK